MLKHTAFAFLFLGLAVAQRKYPEYLDDAGRLPSKVKCVSEVPKDFACAIFFNIDPPFGIVSVVGGENNFLLTMVRQISLILDGTLYTVEYDPPLKPDDKIFSLRRNAGIPARVDGDNLYVKWPDGKEVKAKIVRREKINPYRPEPA